MKVIIVVSIRNIKTERTQFQNLLEFFIQSQGVAVTTFSGLGYPDLDLFSAFHLHISSIDFSMYKMFMNNKRKNTRHCQKII